MTGHPLISFGRIVHNFFAPYSIDFNQVTINDFKSPKTLPKDTTPTSADTHADPE